MFKKVLITLLSIIFILIGYSFAHAYDGAEWEKEIYSDKSKGKVLKLLDTEEIKLNIGDEEEKIKNQKLEVEITEGNHHGEKIILENEVNGLNLNGFQLKENDEVLLSVNEKDNGIKNAYIYQFVRQKYLIYLLVFFIALLLIIGGIRGIKSIVVFAVVSYSIFVMLPKMILQQFNPLFSIILISIIIIMFTLLLLNGFNNSTISAIIGAVSGAIFTGAICIFVGNLSKLSGYSAEQQQMLISIPKSINFKQVLFAGILLGALGIIMDISMSISSGINKEKEENPEAGIKYLIKYGFNIGKNIIGSRTSILILAYAGIALPLMIVLMGYKISFIEIVNEEAMATEIIRILSGAIGILLSVPITVIASSYVCIKYS